MTTSAEEYSFDPDEPVDPEVQAHLGLRAHEYEQDGEMISLPNPANFPKLLDAYILNRFDQQGKDLGVPAYQEFLRDYEIGQVISGAIEIVYDTDFESVIEPALTSPEIACEERRTNYEIALLEVSQHLPEGYSPDVLRDPPAPFEPRVLGDQAA